MCDTKTKEDTHREGIQIGTTDLQTGDLGVFDAIRQSSVMHVANLEEDIIEAYKSKPEEIEFD